MNVMTNSCLCNVLCVCVCVRRLDGQQEVLLLIFDSGSLPLVLSGDPAVVLMKPTERSETLPSHKYVLFLQSFPRIEGDGWLLSPCYKAQFSVQALENSVFSTSKRLHSTALRHPSHLFSGDVIHKFLLIRQFVIVMTIMIKVYTPMDQAKAE